MEAFELSTESLPEPIRERLHAPIVSVHEHEGGLILMPIRSAGDGLWGLLADGRLTSQRFLEQKRLDEELEP